MNKKIFELAIQAGATTVDRHEIDSTTDVWFSCEEFECFITSLVKYQVSVMGQIVCDQDPVFEEGGVPAWVVINGMVKDILNATV